MEGMESDLQEAWGLNKKRSGEFMDLLQEDIKKDPSESMWKIAAERNVAPSPSTKTWASRALSGHKAQLLQAQRRHGQDLLRQEDLHSGLSA
ncbi:Hypothetical protein FKW44_009948 [Caligus rogercresseyi]|uniref:Uncharacterized protein n=1 Tax=Caligus rogercresseyi TaxID=217165 RepID=A0A7T8HGZ4_CALRO|nr:Hypothetical protein FKW44_009948 [Caligus rogercresseyi]